MTDLQIALTVADILALVVVLLYFLNRITRQLTRVSATCAKITFGVRAVETQCAVIGPAADVINANLTQVANGLSRSADIAATIERVTPSNSSAGPVGR